MLPELLTVLAATVPTVSCAEHIETRPVSASDRRRALAGSVTRHGAIFWGLRHAERETFDRRQDSWKSAISVRHGARLHLRVAPADRSWLQLTYDRGHREGVPHLRFTPCAPDTPRFSDDGLVGGETAWAGGFTVGRNGCATLLLRREGEEQWRSVRVGFGARC